MPLALTPRILLPSPRQKSRIVTPMQQGLSKNTTQKKSNKCKNKINQRNARWRKKSCRRSPLAPYRFEKGRTAGPNGACGELPICIFFLHFIPIFHFFAFFAQRSAGRKIWVFPQPDKAVESDPLSQHNSNVYNPKYKRLNHMVNSIFLFVG